MKTMFDMLASDKWVPLAKSKFTKRIGDFDNLCDELWYFIPVVFFHFQWMKANSREQRLVTLRKLGYMLYNLLTDVKKLLEIRPKVLCDEHCGRFEQRVRKIDAHARYIKNFITDADKMIDEAVKNNPEVVTTGVLRQFADYDSLKDWILELIVDQDLMDRAAKKCDEWNLHYDIRLSANPIPDLRSWARTALCCVTMLAVNQHENDSDAELAELFTLNFNAFLEGNYWQDCEKDYTSHLNWRFSRDILTYEKQVAYLDEEYKVQREQMVALLHKVGINYSGIDSDVKRGELCRQLYAHLNGVNMTGDENVTCEKNMRNDDLCRYFTFEARLRLIDMKKSELESLHQAEIKKTATRSAGEEPLRNYIFNTQLFDTNKKLLTLRNTIAAAIDLDKYSGLFGPPQEKRIDPDVQSEWYYIVKAIDESGVARNFTVGNFINQMTEWLPMAIADKKKLSKSISEEKRLWRQGKTKEVVLLKDMWAKGMAGRLGQAKAERIFAVAYQGLYKGLVALKQELEHHQ